MFMGLFEQRTVLLFGSFKSTCSAHKEFLMEPSCALSHSVIFLESSSMVFSELLYRVKIELSSSNVISKDLELSKKPFELTNVNIARDAQ